MSFYINIHGAAFIAVVAYFAAAAYAVGLAVGGLVAWNCARRTPKNEPRIQDLPEVDDERTARS